MRCHGTTALLAMVAVVTSCTSGGAPNTTSSGGSPSSDSPISGIDRASTTAPVSVPLPTPPSAPWSVDTGDCDDPGSANAAITDTVVVGTVAPLSGGLISLIHAPVLEGFRAYIDFANQQALLGDTKLQLVEADDQGNPALTPVAVSGLLDSGAAVIAGMIGSANNLAARELLNTRCVPQLMALGSSPRLGEVDAAPWTMGGVVPVTVETTIYADSIVRSVSADAVVGLLVTDDEAGQSFAKSFRDAAALTDLTLLDDQTVPAASIDPPSIPLLKFANARPDAVVSSLTGAACATFLTELAKVRAIITDWDPAVYMGSACADPSILSLAGEAADGVLTSANLVSTGQDFVDAMTARGLTRGLSTAAQGWTAAEVTVAVLIAAQQSSAGLTRASIINAARNLSYVPSLARDGVRYVTNGVDDPYPAESLQIVRFEHDTQSFSDVGPLIAQFES